MKKIFSLLLIFTAALLNADVSKEQKLKDQVLNALPSVEGWCSKEKALNFIDLVLETKPDVCVEIGVYGGSSLFPVASTLKHLEHGIIIAIDPWDKIECIKYFDPVEDKVNLNWWGKLNLDYIYNLYLKMLKRYDLNEYCITIRAPSEEAVNEIDEPIDILHIDGNFSKEGTSQDVILYLPKVRSGGYIWINDALSTKRQEAVDMLNDACDVVKLIENGNCILFKKR